MNIRVPCVALLSVVTLLRTVSSHAQTVDSPDGNVADLTANYTEAKSGAYTLPDPLLLANGQPVTDAKTWFEKRRPEIFKLIEENQYGRAPGRPAALSFDVFDRETLVFALLGKKGIESYSLPAAGQPLMSPLGYLLHDGPHGMLPADGPVILDFAQRQLNSTP